MTESTIIHTDKQGNYKLAFQKSDVAKIDLSDIDLIVRTKSGDVFVLPGAAYAAMGKTPPSISFSDGSTTADQLLKAIGEVNDLTASKIYDSIDQKDVAEAINHRNDPNELAHLQETLKYAQNKLSLQEKEVLKAQSLLDAQDKEHAQTQEQIQKQAVELAKAQAQIEAQAQAQEQSEQASIQKATIAVAHESHDVSAARYAEKMAQILDEIHTKDFDYSPPSQYQPPPQPFSGPPGVPAPLSMTPLVLLSMGNVVGTLEDISVPGVTKLYGGGGADGSDALAGLGPRDALQFSSATITGTAGNDVIYAEGPLVGNAFPAIDTDHYAKQFLLKIAGYFTQLNDIVFKGLPGYVSVSGATLRADGAWVLPSSYVTSRQSFELVYDKNAWRSSGTDHFDLTIEISGMMRNNVFQSSDSFRFQFMDVTDASQVTNPNLICWLDSQTKQIYVLPTQDQPNIINHGNGDDIVYGGQNNDTITGGSGNNQIHGNGGNDAITEGNGNNNVTTLDGSDIIVVGDGTNTIDAGAGDNVLQVGNGNGNQITTGSGNDQITVGNGNNNVIHAGDGANTIHIGTGSNNQLFTGVGNDTIIALDAAGATLHITDTGGSNVIQAAAGDHVFAIAQSGAATNTITISGTGSNSIIITGDGSDTGVDTITAHDALGTVNTITAGHGSNVISLGDGDNTVTTYGGNDQITVGNGNNTIHAGNGNNIIHLGSGTNSADTGTGNNTFYSGLGHNTLAGGSGYNTADYSAALVALTINLAAGTVAGAGVGDTLSSIHNVNGSNFDDIITGDNSGDVIHGGSGADTITGGTGLDYIYGDAGNNTFNGSVGGDYLYGGTGNDTFLTPRADTHYDGHYGGTITAGEVNRIDYSADGVTHTINLLTGTGVGGNANGSTYANINYLIGGNSTDTLTAANVDTTLDGRNGTNTLTGGSGNDTLIGGTGTDYLYGNGGNNSLTGGAGTNYFYMNTGHDNVIANAGGTDYIYYNSSPSGVVVNLDTVAHVFTDSNGHAGRVVAALNGASNVSDADQTSHAVGDTYQAIGVGQQSGVDFVYGSSSADIIYGYSANTTMQYFYGNGGNDTITGGTGADYFYMNGGNTTIDGVAGNDVFYVNSASNITVYLDGTVDINGNGRADYIDRGVASLNGHAGFANGWSGVTYLDHVPNILGYTGSDYFVGDNNNNEINARSGTNVIYGLGGNDLIFCLEGNNTINGGTGTNTVSFINTGSVSGVGSSSPQLTTSAECFLSNATLLNGHGPSTWGVYSGYQAHTITSGIDFYSTATNVQNIEGSPNDDYLAGDANTNVIHGNNGHDWLTGNGGADSLFGDAGNDNIVVSAAHLATLVKADGGAGTDTLYSSALHFNSGNFATGGLYDSKVVYMEAMDVRTPGNTDTYAGFGLNANDISKITGLALGTTLTLALKLDSGEVFTPGTVAGAMFVTHQTGLGGYYDEVDKYYSNADLAASHLVATLNVHHGTG
jgi:Ca2+-binding RTX toxin-like protein